MLKIITAIKDPKRILIYILYKTARLWPDRIFLKMIFPLRVGYKLNLENPKTFNEKLQWLKLYNRKPIMTIMVDKIEAKKYVANIIGEKYIIPTLGVHNSFEEINFDALPEQFVLKCTHDSGGLVICKDKSSFNIEAAKRIINKSLNYNFYHKLKEWPYKNVTPRIIVEQYMEDESGYELKDYKFFCFDGEPKALFIAADRCVENEETKFNFYDINFNLLPFTSGHPNSNKPIEKPKSFELMKELATKLSKGMPHVRIDFYDIYGKVYFGEMTFYHNSGLVPFRPHKWDYLFGEWIKIPNTK